jgi:cytochrome c biogenesis protein CcmG/thiol:disulfide interchange protein DsbE
MNLTSQPTNKSKTRLAALFIVAALATLALSVHNSLLPADTGLAVIPKHQAKIAPDFTLVDAVSGTTIHLREDAKKQPIVFSFWASWCVPCRAEFSVLEAMSKKYKGRVLFCGINSVDSPEVMRHYGKRFGITFPLLADPTMAVHTKYDVDELPRLVIVDRNATLRVLIAGYSSDEDRVLTKLIDSILADK